MMKLLIAAAALLVVVSARPSQKEIYKIQGRLMCGDTHATNTSVRLYDEDSISADDLLGTVHLEASERGRFRLTSIPNDDWDSLLLEITTKCGRHEGAHRFRTLHFYPPIAHKGNTTPFDIGTIHLEHFYGEESKSWSDDTE